MVPQLYLLMGSEECDGQGHCGEHIRVEHSRQEGSLRREYHA